MAFINKYLNVKKYLRNMLIVGALYNMLSCKCIENAGNVEQKVLIHQKNDSSNHVIQRINAYNESLCKQDGIPFEDYIKIMEVIESPLATIDTNVLYASMEVAKGEGVSPGFSVILQDKITRKFKVKDIPVGRSFTSEDFIEEGYFVDAIGAIQTIDVGDQKITILYDMKNYYPDADIAYTLEDEDGNAFAFVYVKSCIHDGTIDMNFLHSVVEEEKTHAFILQTGKKYGSLMEVFGFFASIKNMSLATLARLSKEDAASFLWEYDDKIIGQSAIFIGNYLASVGYGQRREMTSGQKEYQKIFDTFLGALSFEQKKAFDDMITSIRENKITTIGIRQKKQILAIIMMDLNIYKRMYKNVFGTERKDFILDPMK